MQQGCLNSETSESLHMLNEKLIKVQDNPNLRRDVYSNAVIDVDADSYAKYLELKQQKLSQKARIQDLEERINNFESDISDIKSLLQRLLEKS